MVLIEEILQLPKEEQLAIVHAIQENLDDFGDEDTLSEEQIAFIRERVKANETTHQKTYSWQELQENLKNRWNM